MNRRALILVVLLLAAGVGRLQLHATAPVGAVDLEKFGFSIGNWEGRRGPAFDAAILEVLRPDSYINRVYRKGESAAGLYVGYHRSQERGSAIHSPLNCLPGSGWQPISTERIPLNGRGTANRVVVQKGEDRQLVLYWYHSARRVEGNEYWSKVHLVVDAFTLHRSDAGLVRIIVPINPRIDDGERAATESALELAALVEPQVTRLLFPTE